MMIGLRFHPHLLLHTAARLSNNLAKIDRRKTELAFLLPMVGAQVGNELSLLRNAFRASTSITTLARVFFQ